MLSAPRPSPSSSNTSTSTSTLVTSPRRDVQPPQSPPHKQDPLTSKRRRGPSPPPSSRSKRHRLSNSTMSPNLLLHQRLNAVQDIFTHLIDAGTFPTDSLPIREAMRRCQELGSELDEHFGEQSEPSNICPACNLTLSKMCHLRRHVRTKAVKCPKHAALLSDMSSMQCRRCKRQFTRREDASRHESKCSISTPPPPNEGPNTENAPPAPPTRSTSPSTRASTAPASPILAPTWSSVNDNPTGFPSSAPKTRSESSKPSASLSSLSTLLAHIFTTLPSILPLRQRNQFHTCLLRITPTPAQSQEVGRILTRVLNRHAAPAWGRERIMEFMVREKGTGVESWAPALARAVESIIFETDNEAA